MAADSNYCCAGLLQVVFTLGCLLLFLPLYHSFCLSCIWQVRLAVFAVAFQAVVSVKVS